MEKRFAINSFTESSNKKRKQGELESAGNEQNDHIDAAGEIEIDKLLLEKLSAEELYELAKQEQQVLLGGQQSDVSFGFDSEAERVLVKLYEEAISKFKKELNIPESDQVESNSIGATRKHDELSLVEIDKIITLPAEPPAYFEIDSLDKAKTVCSYLTCVIDFVELLRIEGYAFEALKIARYLPEAAKIFGSLAESFNKEDCEKAIKSPSKSVDNISTAFGAECVVLFVRFMLLSTIFHIEHTNSLDEFGTDFSDDFDTEHEEIDSIDCPTFDNLAQVDFPLLDSLFGCWNTIEKLSQYSTFAKNPFDYIKKNITLIWDNIFAMGQNTGQLDYEMIRWVVKLSERMVVYMEINPSLKQANQVIFSEFTGVLCYELFQKADKQLGLKPELKTEQVQSMLFELKINCCKSLILAYQTAGHYGILKDYNPVYLKEAQKILTGMISDTEAQNDSSAMISDTEAQNDSSAIISDAKVQNDSSENQDTNIKLADLLKLLAESKLVEISSFLVDNESEILEEYESTIELLKRAHKLNPQDESIPNQLLSMGLTANGNEKDDGSSDEQ
ncbi:hypothetical protein BB561_001122 [Smittium simulii]|uniref:Uncharacterized protein n=1 Tax=Smittium simulii TaxID=133385 RepID=A0A2T9YVZ3_9FUNG|nr:hypothetical protein BB561_001122 [Smittium simulii]